MEAIANLKKRFVIQVVVVWKPCAECPGDGCTWSKCWARNLLLTTVALRYTPTPFFVCGSFRSLTTLLQFTFSVFFCSSLFQFSSAVHFCSSIRHQNSSAVLGVSVCGFSSDTSYGYPGGMRLSPIQCNCGQNSICLNNTKQFNCSCSNGLFASFSGTDELICNGRVFKEDHNYIYSLLHFTIAITCPPLIAPINGFVTYSSSTSDENGNYAMANHSCDTGFVLVGNNTRTCTGDGSSTILVFSMEKQRFVNVSLFKTLLLP